LPVHLNRFLRPDHIINPIESGVTHGSDKSFRNAEQFSQFASIVPDVDPNAGLRCERDCFKNGDKIADIVSHRRFSS
jgi:hypothetical protein